MWLAWSATGVAGCFHPSHKRPPSCRTSLPKKAKNPLGHQACPEDFPRIKVCLFFVSCGGQARKKVVCCRIFRCMKARQFEGRPWPVFILRSQIRSTCLRLSSSQSNIPASELQIPVTIKCSVQAALGAWPNPYPASVPTLNDQK